MKTDPSARVAEFARISDDGWRTGCIETFDYCLVRIRKAWAASDNPSARVALEVLGRHLKTERDRRFTIQIKAEAIDEEAPEPTSAG